MTTFLLGWCVLSLVGTLFALSLIRAGKRRQPDIDDDRHVITHASVSPAAQKH